MKHGVRSGILFSHWPINELQTNWIIWRANQVFAIPEKQNCSQLSSERETKMMDSQNAGEASVRMHSFPANFPVPTAMICTGDLTGNWEFFNQQWMYYENAMSLDKKSEAMKLAMLRSVMGKDCLQIFLNLDCGLGDLTVAEALAAPQKYFLPKRNVVYERYVFNSYIQTLQETVVHAHRRNDPW